MNKLIVICLLLLMVSCVKHNDAPVGPILNNDFTSYGQYVIVGENLISDFGGTSSAEGLSDAYKQNANSGSTIVTDITNEMISGKTNKYLKFKHTVGQIGDEDVYCRVDFLWPGEIKLADYGNAIMFKAKTISGAASLIVSLQQPVIITPDDYNTYNKKVLLTDEWQVYILMFDEFTRDESYPGRTKEYSFANNTGVGFGPPVDTIGASGIICMDDIKFIYYAERR